MNLFLDTNVLLSFYHFNKDDTKELKKLNTLVRDNSIKLLMTQQVIDEYYRNRTNKIKDSISKLKEQRKAPKFPRIATSYKKYNDVIEAYKNYDKEYQNLIEKIYEDIKNFTLPADSIIKDLFKLSTVLEVEDFIIEKAKKRMIIGNPPGKKNSHGDAINWETLLNNKDSIEELHFISIDADYESVLNE